MYFNKYIKIKFQYKFIAVYINKKKFFTQDYILNQDYTFFLVVLILGKYGFVNAFK